ncbi:MAG: hypothetical protein J0L99_13880 [Chitinophagales bacterium]|nr:hypothetical protein [Chitinophagales bacterium]
MDASKLLNILYDFSSDDEKIITETLNSLVSNISANQSVEISANLKQLHDLFSSSVSNKYNPSNLKIVEFIGGSSYFGLPGFQKLEDILNKNSYDIKKTVIDLQEFIQKRTEFINATTTTIDSLVKLNIRPHFHSDDIFEVGLLMPKELTNNKINKITKELNQWDKVFKTLQEITSGSAEDTEISFINNGSLEFFIDNAPPIAACLAVIVERIVKIYKNITEIRNLKEKLKELGVSTGEQKTIEQQEKDLLNKELDKIANDIVKDFASKQLDSGRINELKIAIKGHITYIARCIDGGMIIEINPPEISEPVDIKDTDTDENKKEKAKLKDNYDKSLKQIEIVEKSMETIKAIGKTGYDIVKYLTDGELPKEEE